MSVYLIMLSYNDYARKAGNCSSTETVETPWLLIHSGIVLWKKWQPGGYLDLYISLGKVYRPVNLNVEFLWAEWIDKYAW